VFKAQKKQNSGNRNQLLRILLMNIERKRVYGAQLNKVQTSSIYAEPVRVRGPAVIIFLS
jgi:hypothetical protein